MPDKVVERLVKDLQSHDAAALAKSLAALKEGSASSVNAVCSSDTLRTAVAEHFRTWDRAGEKGDAVCDWLYDWWSGDEDKESLFVLSCVPDMLWIYLFKTAHGIALPGLEAVLIGIHNTEALTGVRHTFRTPNLTVASTLHTAKAPSKLKQAVLTEISIEEQTTLYSATVEQEALRVIGKAHEKSSATMSASLRWVVVEEVVRRFGQYIHVYHRNVNRAFLDMLTQVCYSGYAAAMGRSDGEKEVELQSEAGPVLLPRLPIAISDGFLKRCLDVLSFYLHRYDKRRRKLGAAVEAVILRAEVDLSHEVLISANSLLYLLQHPQANTDES